MELIIATVILSLLLSVGAFTLSVFNTIHLQAQKLSTHTVMPISPGSSTMGSIEADLEKIIKDAGGSQQDLNRNLFNQGLDPEDLV